MVRVRLWVRSGTLGAANQSLVTGIIAEIVEPPCFIMSQKGGLLRIGREVPPEQPDRFVSIADLGSDDRLVKE